MPGKAVLKIQNIVKSYKGKVALDNISMELNPGKIYGVIGTKDAGKTTLSNLCMGFDSPDSGSIEVCGIQPKDEQSCISFKKQVGYVPHDLHFYPVLKIRQLIDFTKKLYPNWDSSLFSANATLLHIKQNSKIISLSHIEKVRFALCTALSYHPKLLILDDPTANLDTVARHEFHTVIDSLLRNKEMTTLFASHVIDDVERIAEKVYVLQNGKLTETFEVKSIQERFRRVSFVFDSLPTDNLTIPEARYIRKGAREWVLVFENVKNQQIINLANKAGVKDFAFLPLSLEQLFLEMSLHTTNRGQMC